MFAGSRYLSPLRHNFDNGRKVAEVWKQFSRTKKTDCWMPVCGVLVRRVPIDDPREKCRINTFLMENLFKDDPLMIAAGMSCNDPDPGIIQYFAQSINEGNSLYSMIDMTREIIGVCIARYTTPGTAKEMHRISRRLTYPQSEKYMKVLATVEERSKVYHVYNVEKALSIDCLCTGRNFRRRGIAKILLKTIKDMAADDPKCKLLKFISTNTYSSRAAVNCGGMKLQMSKNPIEYRDDKGNPIIDQEMCPPHKNVDLFVGVIHKK